MTNYRELQENFEREHLSPFAKKSYEAKRWKEDKPDPYRTNYQRDIGRILYSNEFRRLRMKTQVFTATGTNQHNRTRLTHSLEVAQIAKSIARPLKLNVDLTEAIALGHDLGHTPFGHAGEFALNECMKQTRNSSFNHNVQSVWLVRTSLSNRKDKYGNTYRGLNLTHDVVEGIWKHTKYSHTIDELEELKLYRPYEPASLEGQTVDIADGIAYLIHDIEDSVSNNLLKYDEIKEIWEQHTDIPFDENYMIHNLIYDVINYSYNKNAISFSPEMEVLYKSIKNYFKEKVLKSEYVTKLDNEGIEKITTIFYYYHRDPEKLKKIHPRINEYKIKKYGIERAIVDYIQWLGDENANREYKKITSKAKIYKKT